MDYNNEYEQEIDLKELMFSVLHRWRPMVILAVVLMVALGGYKAVTTYRALSDPEAMEEVQEKYEEDLRNYNKKVEANDRELENIKEDIANQEEYLEKSVLMGLSPYDVWEARAELFIKTDYEIIPSMTYQNPDFTGAVLQLYQSALTNAEFMDKVAKESDLESRFLKELVTISVRNNNLLSIQVRHQDKESAEAVLDRFVDGVKGFKSQVQRSIVNHTVTEVDRSLGSLVDLSMADRQKNESDRLISLNDSLEEKKREIDDLEEPEEPASSYMSAFKSGAKYGIVGCVLGAFAIAFFACVMFVLSDKVYSAKELKNRFRLKVLGTLPLAKTKKAGKIDRWLNEMEGRACGKDEEEEYGLISANLNNYTDGARSVMVAGSADKALIDQVTEKLREKLENVEVLSGGNLLLNAESLKKLPECDGVVLVEQCGLSKYSSVELELEKIQDLGKKVVGCVVFE